jgi:hypothetical protein
MKRFLIAAWLFSLTLPASANFLTYSQWAALPENVRGMYIVGAVDQFTTIAGGEGDKIAISYALHYSNCLGRAKMNGAQLANNVINFVSSHPDLQTGSVPAALMAYLLAACGEPPEWELVALHRHWRPQYAARWYVEAADDGYALHRPGRPVIALRLK